MASRRDLSMREAETEAARVLDEQRAAMPPIDPCAIAEREGIRVEQYSSDTPGFSGALIRRGASFTICYATHVNNTGFRRFTIAHELGHYFLPGHPEHLLDANGVHLSKAGFASANMYEAQADRFAAALLMPRVQFKAALDKTEPGLTAMKELSETFQVSLTAAAIRFTTLSDHPVGVILSDGSRVSFSILSDPLKEFPKLKWIEKGSPIPRSTATASAKTRAAGDIRRLHAEESVDLRDWFDGGPSVEVFEEVIGLGSYGRVMTVLTTEPLDGETEDDEHEAPSWR